MEKIECIRCGMCCLACPCGDIADLDEFDVCKYLIIHDDDEHTTCELIQNGECRSLLGSGCFIRRWDEVYQMQKELLEEAGKTLKNIRRLRAGGKNE